MEYCCDTKACGGGILNGSYVVDIVGRAGFEALSAAEWDALAASALEPNPYYARSFFLAGLRTVDSRVQVQAVTVHRNGVLVGLFPFRLKTFPLKRAVASANHYQPSGQPLIHREHADGVVRAWLNAIDKSVIPKRWTFKNIELTSRFLALCAQHDHHNAFRTIPTGSYRRARLDRRTKSFEAHLESVISKRRAKDIQRTIRRLEELGTLSFERVTDPGQVERRLEDFLAMEHGGWKGKMGTSFLAHAADGEFARQAYISDGALRTSVDSLLLNGQPIAISINLQVANTVFTPKCSYDEAYRKYSPGLALEYLIVQAFYESDEDVEMDSSTTVDGHVVEGLWNSQVQMGSVVIGPKGLGTSFVAGAQRLKAGVRGWLKAQVQQGKTGGLAAAWRSLVRKVRSTQTNIVLGMASFPHAAEYMLELI